MTGTLAPGMFWHVLTTVFRALAAGERWGTFAFREALNRQNTLQKKKDAPQARPHPIRMSA